MSKQLDACSEPRGTQLSAPGSYNCGAPRATVGCRSKRHYVRNGSENRFFEPEELLAMISIYGSSLVFFLGSWWKSSTAPATVSAENRSKQATEAAMPWEGSPDSMKRKSGDRPSSCRFESTSEGSVDDDSSKASLEIRFVARADYSLPDRPGRSAVGCCSVSEVLSADGFDGLP